MKREGKKKGKEGKEGKKNDLFVFVFVSLFCERDFFFYGRYISYVDREGVEVVFCNIKVD